MEGASSRRVGEVATDALPSQNVGPSAMRSAVCKHLLMGNLRRRNSTFLAVRPVEASCRSRGALW